ncbi:MAG: CD225/dispanin family protein [Acidimicrobiales bacterium]
MTAYEPVPSRQTNTGLLVGSILATLFCCLPLGVVAIVFAAQETTSRPGRG